MRRLAAVTALALVSGLALAACVAPTSKLTLPRLEDASISVGDRTVASVAMGHLHNPANTFWQLLTQRGAGRWTLVTPPGVATNGGIAVSMPTEDDLVVAVLPSLLLRFTALARSSNGGRSWSSGIYGARIATLPDAIGGGPNGSSVAVTSGRAGAVVTSRGLSGWAELATRSSIAASAGGCPLRSLTAVTVGAGSVVVAGRCETAVAPIAQRVASRWKLVGPTLGVAANVDVLRLVGTETGAVCIAIEGSGSSRTVLALSSSDGFATWHVARRGLGAAQVTASAVAADGDVAVLVSPRRGADEAYAITRPMGEWTRLPAPPHDVALLTVNGSGTVEALAVDGSVLTVYAARTHRWAPVQQLFVPIQYGSSS